jgi:hypothetical protein
MLPNSAKGAFHFCHKLMLCLIASAYPGYISSLENLYFHWEQLPHEQKSVLYCSCMNSSALYSGKSKLLFFPLQP